MKFQINTTNQYHKEELNTLGWEMTICNSLYHEDTAVRRILTSNRSFGMLLYNHLNKYIEMETINKIIEIGGGYGYLMRDFLSMNSYLKPTMVDISPFLLERQQETLKGYNVSFIEMDFLEIRDDFLRDFDLAIMNENLGDFPTVVSIDYDVLKTLPLDNNDPILKKTIYFFEKYGLHKPECNPFNFNIGAVEAVEKLCSSGIPYIYLGEHSCEAVTPEKLRHLIKILPSGNPERISLKGHDEYTIKFSYLEKIAGFFGYRTVRGNFADFINFHLDEKIFYIMSSQGRYSDEDEIIYHFIEDLYKYEYLILVL